MKRHVLLLLTVFLVIGLGQELIQNGGFEDSLRYWTVEYDNNQGNWEVSRATTHQPDPDYEAYVKKYDRYYARLKQTVDVPTTDVDFSASAKLYARHISGTGYYAYSTVILAYVDARRLQLGRTMIVLKTANCNLQNSSTQHVITVTSTNWEDYGFNIATELANLPGVNPALVTGITVYLESYGTGRSG